MDALSGDRSHQNAEFLLLSFPVSSLDSPEAFKAGVQHFSAAQQQECAGVRLLTVMNRPYCTCQLDLLDGYSGLHQTALPLCSYSLALVPAHNLLVG